MIRAIALTDSHTGAFRLVAGSTVAAVMLCALMPPAIQHQHLLAGEAFPAASDHGSRGHSHRHHHHCHHHHHVHHHRHAASPAHNADESSKVVNGRAVRHWHYLLFGFNFTVETPDGSPSRLPEDRPDAVDTPPVSIAATNTSTPAAFQVGNPGVSAELIAPVVAPQGLHPPPLQSMHGPPLCHAAELLRSGVRLV